MNPYTLKYFWELVFWSSQALTWLVLPITEGFFSAGDFTFWTKLLQSIRENAIVCVRHSPRFFLYFSAIQDRGF